MYDMEDEKDMTPEERQKLKVQVFSSRLCMGVGVVCLLFRLLLFFCRGRVECTAHRRLHRPHECLHRRVPVC